MTTTTDMITRCPQCATAFRATAEVLRVANGTVRCGSCLSVFNAKTQSTESALIENTSEKSTASENEPANTPPHSNDHHSNEDWAIDLLKDEEINNEPEDDFDEEAYINDTAELSPSPDDSAIINIINNDLQDNHQDDLDIIKELEQEASDNDNDDTLLNNIPDDAFSFDDHHSSTKRWPWVLGATVMAIILTLQVAWLRFDSLGTREPYLEYYTKACDILGCQLPTISDLKQIRTTHLVVRSHPDETHALIIDAIIINNAPFEQVFPALRLAFRNIHGKTVASRDFQPREYLKGELTGAAMMPAKQPIQLSLAIVDPGESAVNYHIDTVAAKSDI